MRCHKSYEPVAYSQPLWDSWMFKMRKKAHLGPAQEALLHRYLDAYRANSPMAKTNSATGGVRSPGSAKPELETQLNRLECCLSQRSALAY